MIRLSILSVIILLSVSNVLFAQVLVEGYAYESGNRGYLNQVLVEIKDASGQVLGSTQSDQDGKFEVNVAESKKYILIANKEMFHQKEMDVLSEGKNKVFVKLEMERAPGYLFEITLAEKREDPEQEVNQIMDAWIEIYNNTTEQEILNLKDYKQPEFSVNLLKGNHYTILIRKDKYLSKRMEAYVDVKGCILCFEGIGDVRPGVTDNLTEGNEMGSLLANVELEPVYRGKKIELQNIYYDYGKSSLRADAVEELEKVATFLRDNPRLTVELGSHTDSRGTEKANMKLSRNRAKSAVEYLINEGGVRYQNIEYKGYGETQLVNRCKDGADCTDYEHQLNRRTELKVIGISDEIDTRTLKRMKQDEKMEAMILELDQEQIQIPADGQLPDDLKKKLNEKENMLDSEGTNEKGIEIEEEVEEVEQKKEADTSQVKEEMPASKIKSDEEVENLKEEVENAAESVEVKTEEKIEEKKAEVMEATDELTRAVVSEAPIKESAPIEEPAISQEENLNVDPANLFTGYKILLSESSEAIPSIQNLLGDLASDVEEMKDESGVYQYYFGNFDSLDVAKEQLGSSIVEMFPSSKIVAFKDGLRISN